MASMAWDMTETAADAAEGPQAQLEDGAARLFCSARNVGEAGRGKKPRTAVAALSGRGEAAFGHQAFRRGREGQGLASRKGDRLARSSSSRPAGGLLKLDQLSRTRRKGVVRRPLLRDHAAQALASQRACDRRRVPWYRGRSTWRVPAASRHSSARPSDSLSADSTSRDSRRASCHSRRTDKTCVSSAQRDQNKHAIPVGACRRQRAPIGNRAPSSGGAAGAQPPAEGVRTDQGCPSGEGFPSFCRLPRSAD